MAIPDGETALSALWRNMAPCSYWCTNCHAVIADPAETWDETLNIAIAITCLLAETCIDFRLNP